MQSVDTLSTPQEWPPSRYRLTEWISLAVFALLVPVLVLVGIGGWLAGETAVLRYCCGFAVAIVLIVSSGVEARSNRHCGEDIRTVDDNGTPATELRYSRRGWYLTIALVAACAVLCIGAAVEIHLNAGDAGLTRGTLTFGAFGLYFAGHLVTIAVGRARLGYVRLSPVGIHQRGWTFESTLPWDAIAGAKPAYNTHRMVLVFAYPNVEWARRHTTRLWKLDRLPPVPMIELPATRFAIDDVLLAHLVTYYANNPETRGELGTDAALQRAAHRDYPPLSVN